MVAKVASRITKKCQSAVNFSNRPKEKEDSVTTARRKSQGKAQPFLGHCKGGRKPLKNNLKNSHLIIKTFMNLDTGDVEKTMVGDLNPISFE